MPSLRGSGDALGLELDTSREIFGGCPQAGIPLSVADLFGDHRCFLQTLILLDVNPHAGLRPAAV